MLTVGVDVGGTSVRAGLVDASGAVLDVRRVATPKDEQGLEDAIVGVVTELVTMHRGVRAVGLAVAGFVSRDRRHIEFAPHLPWRGVPVAGRIEYRLGLPVLLEHDANAAVVAEHRYGVPLGGEVGVLVVLGTGIGGALLVDGELFRGAYGVAPELGHLRLVPEGRPCSCGKRGCWERYCSGTGLATTALELLAARRGAAGSLAREASGDPQQLSGRRVALAARNGDPVALRAMAELARWLGEGLALVADVYDPEVVVIGGAVSESAPLFLDDAREHYAAVVTGSGYRRLARIRTTQLGAEAGIVGAALLARSVA
ncbi:MAG: ROK family protein [Pseudonocardiaceae bacterium]